MMVEIAYHSRGFTLFERPACHKNGWLSLKLIASGRRRKRNWWLGWNGDRLARNSDAGRLQDQEPEIYDWVIAALGERSAAHTAHTPTL
jgi:hypothetical protein